MLEVRKMQFVVPQVYPYQFLSLCGSQGTVMDLKWHIYPNLSTVVFGCRACLLFRVQALSFFTQHDRMLAF